MWAPPPAEEAPALPRLGVLKLRFTKEELTAAAAEAAAEEAAERAAAGAGGAGEDADLTPSPSRSASLSPLRYAAPRSAYEDEDDDPLLFGDDGGRRVALQRAGARPVPPPQPRTASSERRALSDDIAAVEPPPPPPRPDEPAAELIDRLVWARLPRYPAWPAQLLSSFAGHQAPPRPSPRALLVHFFGTYDIQWVSDISKISPWAEKYATYATACKQKVFLKAVAEADRFYSTGESNGGALPYGMTGVYVPGVDPPSLPSQLTHTGAKAAAAGGTPKAGRGAAGAGGGKAAKGAAGAKRGAAAAAAGGFADDDDFVAASDGTPRRIKVARRLGLLPPAPLAGAA